jgi:amino acid adenylation domain-containing protein
MNKLDRRSIRYIAGLTPMQQGMLFHYLEHPQGTQYVQQLCLHLEGPLDTETAREAWDAVAAANPPLRTLFRWDAINQPVQMAQKEHSLEFRIVDCPDAEALETAKRRDLTEAFDLRHVPFRVTVCRMEGGDCALLVSYHHILMDGWSMAVMLRQFLTAYGCEIDGETLQLPLNDSFREFVAWSQKRDAGKEEEFWREYLDGCSSRSPFPFAGAADDQPPDGAAQRFEYELSEAEARMIGQLVQQHKVTPATVFYTAWGVLLQKYTGSDDALLGTTVSGRSAPIDGINEAMGLFINTLPLPIVSGPNDCGSHLLRAVAGALRKREAFEHTGLTAIRRYAGLESSQELFDTLVVMENYPLQKQLAGNGPLTVRSYSMQEQTNYNLALAIEETEGSYSLTWIFKPGPMPRWLTRQAAAHFSRVLNFLATEPQLPVWRWELPDEEEKKRRMEEWNDTAADYPREKTIHQLALEQAQRQPDAVALVWAGDAEGSRQCVEQITFREFAARATVLAHHLKERGAGGGLPVAVRLERSLSLVITLQAVLMTGCAYLPVDPSYPEGRIDYMLKDSGCRIELSDLRQVEAAMYPEALETKQSFPMAADSDLPAYVIYTSGSTGLPKGVLVRHRSIVNTLWWRIYAYGFSDRDAVLQIPSFSFDSSVEDIWSPLLGGAKLVMLSESLRLDPRYLKTAIQRGRVSHFLITPHFYRTLLAEFETPPSSLTSVTVAGEGFDIDLVRLHFQSLPHVRLLNEYGPTENSVCSTVYEFSPSDRQVVVGTPIHNAQCSILDSHGNCCPTGVAGELCLSGVGLAAGYLNRPESTLDAFGSNHDLYRTGDRTLRQPDGNIRFLGRLDLQVKIRGFRVELQEIEGQLARHEAVKEAVVTARENSGGDNTLCAYVTLAIDVEMSELEAFLHRQLPAYMVPSAFVALERLPLTAHGKVDLKGLPQPAEAELQRYVPPRDQLDHDLQKIWAAVLEKEVGDIGIDHNFFELGGHSLKAMTLSSRLHKELGVPVPIGDIFDHPTIRRLRRCIDGPAEEVSDGIPVFEKQDYYDLSFAQRRLWILCQFEEDSTAYNMPGVFSLKGGLDIPAFTAAVQTLADRHDSLRTRFFSLDGVPKQQVLDTVKVKPVIEDVRALGPDERLQAAKEMFARDADSPFRLEEGGLFRVSLILMEEEHTILVFNTHHIISDGWSTGIIRKEIFALYNAYTNGQPNPLPPLTVQYKDYTLWHNRLIDSDGFGDSEGYWLDKFADRPNGIELPLDFSRRPIQTFNGGRVSLIVDPERAKQLEALGRRQDATMFMCLLTFTAAILQRYSGQRDIIVGSPTAGRQHPELHHMTGFLVNTLVFRVDVDPHLNFSRLLQAVKQETLRCYQYQDYPFDLLMEKLELDRDLSQSPLFNFMMAHNNTWTHEASSDMSGVELSGVEFADEFNMSKFDLVFIMDLIDDELDIKIEYNSDLFRRDTILRMRDNMNTLLDSILETPERPLHQLPFLHPVEAEMVTRGFNHNRRPFPQSTVQELIQRQLEEHPGAIAVTHHDQSLTYEELNRRANRTAHSLRTRFGAGPNRVLGVTMERSLEMIVALLGIVKSGAGYVAIDPTYPPDRVEHMLKDSNAGLVMIDGPRPQLFAAYEGELVMAEELSAGSGGNHERNPDILNGPDDILYVIYTSGSTGTPNGAMLSQRILSNLLQWERYETSIDMGLRCLQFTSINFCVSFQEIFGTLSGGGQVLLIGDVERQDIDFLMHFLAARRVGLLYLPFSYLNFLFNESGRWGDFFHHNLRHIITAGEQLKITAGLKQFLRMNPELRLHNHYGSSEMHVVTSFTLDASETERYPVPPAGKPVANTSIYILDPQGNPVATGVWGELCIAGAGEVLGYINNPELTAKKVQSHPLSPATRLYHSGDIGRWLPDGNIEIKGRKDFQVKVRGFRVEPAEIESKIFALPEVKDCVVTVRDDEKKQKYLAAYIVIDGATPLDIRRRLAAVLPNYMVPKLVVLESLPLMANGKVDRDKLPDPQELQQRTITLEPAQVNELLNSPLRWRDAQNRPLAERVAAYIQLARESFPHLHLPLQSITMETEAAAHDIGDGFATMVENAPGAVAAAEAESGDAWSFARLDHRASRLAERLPASMGHKHALLMKPSLQSLEAMIAVGKKGGSVMELEPGLDRRQLRESLQQARAGCLLTASDMLEQYPFTTLQSLGHGDAPLVKTPPRPAITHLDSLPLLDRSTVNYEKYSQSIGITMVKHCVTILSSRGCPYHCAYCHKIWPKKQVCRSAENIFAEVETFYNMGVRRFAFVDDIFNLNEKNSSRFFRMVLDRGIKAQFYFSGGLRGDILSKPFIDLMVEAGTVDIAVALETASPRLQKLIGKNLDVEKLRDSLQYIAETYPHVILELHSMHGFPTETEEEARMTLDFINSIHWLDFPYIHVMKIYPNTPMQELALKNGVSAEAILESEDLAFHQWSATMPFERSFTQAYQAEFLNNYFLDKERLRRKLPQQAKILTEGDMVQKYDSYLPAAIRSLDDIISFTGMGPELQDCRRDDSFYVPDLNQKMARHFGQTPSADNALRILLLDLSQFFRADGMLFDVVEVPLGLLSLQSYVKRELGDKVRITVAKARVDFDSYDELKRLMEDVEPQLIGIRALTFYKHFFHKTVNRIRHWGFGVPIVAGGPYASSDYATILNDRHIDVAVIGEGELTFTQLVEAFLAADNRLPGDGELARIQGLAYVPRGRKREIRSAAVMVTDIVTDGGELNKEPRETTENAPLQPVSLVVGGSHRDMLAPLEAGHSLLLPPGGLNDDEMLRLDLRPVIEDNSGHSRLDLRVWLRDGVDRGPVENETEAPQDRTETRLAAIWADLLGIDAATIGREDNFFDIGGHSLKATLMVSRLHQEFSAQVPLVDVFQSPTLRELADVVRNARSVDHSGIQAVERRDVYPLSSGQARIFVQQGMREDNRSYNMPTALRIEGELDRGTLEETIRRLIVRHEAMRTYFVIAGGRPVQRIAANVDFSLENLPPIDRSDQNVDGVILDFIRPFDLATPPLVRVGLAAWGPDRHVLVFDIHHIVSDGISMAVLVKDFMALYNGAELEPLPVQYKDFACRQREMEAADAESEAMTYWLQQFIDEAPPLRLPLDFPRPDLQTYAGRRIVCSMDPNLAEGIRRLAADTGSTVYMVLLAAYNILLHRYTGLEDLTVGTAVAGREHRDIEEVMGMFVNMIPMRNLVDPNDPFSRFLRKLKERVLEAFSHQDCQFEELVRRLNLRGQYDRNPLFSTVFQVQNVEIPRLRIPGLSLEPIPFERGIANFDLVLLAMEEGDNMELALVYSTEVFKWETAQRFLDRFLEICHSVVETPDQLIKDIDISSDVAQLNTDILAGDDEDFDF